MAGSGFGSKLAWQADEHEGAEINFGCMCLDIKMEQDGPYVLDLGACPVPGFFGWYKPCVTGCDSALQ